MTTDTKVAEVKVAYLPNVGAAATARRKYHHVMNGGSLTPHDVAAMVETIEKLEAALARKEADKTKAAIWIEFAENGNIRFWTSDQDRAIEESFCHARSLAAYYAAPPAAQAVDLSDDFSESKDWRESDYNGRVDWLKAMHASQRAEIVRLQNDVEILRALIDQQAGKGVSDGK